MKKFDALFMKVFTHTYPKSFHLSKYLRYYILKYKIIKKILTFVQTCDQEEVRICDVGGGYGYDGKIIVELAKKLGITKKIHIDVIDQNVNFYQDMDASIHNTKRPEITYNELSFLDIDMSKYKEKYDIVMSSEVVEHLTTFEQEKFFVNFNGILKDHGTIYITCPNGSSVLKNLFALYSRRKQNLSTFEDEFNHRYAHIGIPTIFQAIGLFASKWFRLDHIYPTALTSGVRLNILNRIINKIGAIFPYVNLFFTCNCLFVAQKKTSIDKEKRYNSI